MQDYRPIHNSMKDLCAELIEKNWICTQKVYDTMMKVDRADFAPTNPYENNPQCINFNVVISAPLLHAYCLEALKNHLIDGCTALDIGFGSGYLTAAMSLMIGRNGKVIGVEHIKQLYDFGKNNIMKNHSNLLEAKKIELFVCDGRKGYKPFAPYNCIHVGAGAMEPPKELIEQLANGGRLVIPLGPQEDQYIYIIDKDFNGNIKYSKGLCVRYVPLTTPEKQLSNSG